jgi:hypothetical protein
MAIEKDLKFVEKELKKRGRKKGSKKISKQEQNKELMKRLYDNKQLDSQVQEKDLEEERPKLKFNYQKKHELVSNWGKESRTIQRTVETDFEGPVVIEE